LTKQFVDFRPHYGPAITDGIVLMSARL
jgi:hypothetical protein